MTSEAKNKTALSKTMTGRSRRRGTSAAAGGSTIQARAHDRRENPATLEVSLGVRD